MNVVRAVERATACSIVPTPERGRFLSKRRISSWIRSEERPWLGSRPHRDIERARKETNLSVGEVHGLPQLFVESLIAYAPDDSDNLVEILGVERTKALANRALSRPVLFGEGTAHNRRAKSLVAVAPLEGPPLEERNRKREEVVRAHETRGMNGRNLALGHGEVFDEDGVIVVAAGKRQPRGDGNGRDARKRSDLLGELSYEPYSLLFSRILAFRKRELERKRRLRIETRFDRLQARVAPRHETRSDEEHEGEGYLAGDQDRPRGKPLSSRGESASELVQPCRESG